MTVTDDLATGSPAISKRIALNFMRDNFIYAVLVALIVFFTIMSPYFLTSQNLANIGRQTAIVSIIAVGMTFVIITAQIDLSVGSVFALCGIMAALAMQSMNFWLIGAVVAIGTGILCGFVNGFVTVKLGIPSFLVTLGMLGVARGVALIITDTRPVLIANDTYFNIFGEGRLFGTIPVGILWTAVVVAIGWVVLKRMTFGTRVYATGGNPVAARFTGIKTGQTVLISFMILGGLVGLGSLLFTGIAHAARPDLGSGLELDVIAAVILGGVSLFGGRGTIIGALVGSLIIGVLNNGLVLLGVGPSIQDVIKGVVIVAAVSLARRS